MERWERSSVLKERMFSYFGGEWMLFIVEKILRRVGREERSFICMLVSVKVVGGDGVGVLSVSEREMSL